MKRTALLLLGAAMSLNMVAQDLPQPSPSAEVKQRVGLTDITINYSRPGVKGREIWGGVVPMGSLWRTGANKATAITFSTDVKVGGTTVPAGSYSFFSIPGAENWTLILNKNTELWGADGYSQDMDVVRVTAKPMKSDFTERLSIGVEEFSDNAGVIRTEWENMAIDLPFEVEVDAQAEKNIAAALAATPDWRTYRNAANYYNQKGIMPAKALEYITKSVELKGDNWYSHWLHGQILASNGKYKEAIKAGEKSIEVGKAQEGFNYTEAIGADIAKWKEASKGKK